MSNEYESQFDRINAEMESNHMHRSERPSLFNESTRQQISILGSKDSKMDLSSTVDDVSLANSKRPYYLPKGQIRIKKSNHNPANIKFGDKKEEEEPDVMQKLSKLKPSNLLNQYGSKLPYPMIQKLGYEEKFDHYKDQPESPWLFDFFGSEQQLSSMSKTTQKT